VERTGGDGYQRRVAATTLKPGDTIVVPAWYGGIRSGCFDATSTDPATDRAEQANLLARARPALRLHPTVTDGLEVSLPLDEPEEVRGSLGRLASNGDWPAWKRLWAQKLAKGRSSFVVSGDSSWTVIEARRVPLTELRKVVQAEETLEDGVELTTDGDDSFCAGRAVSLSEHSADVETFAREYATRCGLGGGSPSTSRSPRGCTTSARPIVASKSCFVAGVRSSTSRTKRRGPNRRCPQERAQHASWPASVAATRAAATSHAVQSVAMLDGQKAVLVEWLKKGDATREPDLDLVLHLVASHHGECRPFAPVVVDSAPIKISLAGHSSSVFGKIDFSEVPSNPELHRLDSPLADRFWTLVAKYGWQELCWLEAVLRLADHRASEEEQNANADA
jgi:CRISPR-associated endonuclease/helicase Cas3